MDAADGTRRARRRRLLAAGAAALPAALPLAACSTRLVAPERGPFVVVLPRPDSDAGRTKRIASGIEGAKRAWGVPFRIVENIAPETNAMLGALRAAADSDAKMVVGFGAAMGGPMQRVAWEFPEQRFSLVDGPLDALRPNLALYQLLAPQSWFLAGTLAGRLTRSNAVGLTVRADRDLSAAFAAGLRLANPDARLLANRASSLGEAVVSLNGQRSADADVTMIADAPWTPAAMNAIADAAAARQLTVIDEGTDWGAARPAWIAASIVDEPGDALLAAIRDLRDAVWRGDIVRRLGVRTGAIGLSLATTLPPSVRAVVESEQEQVAAGRFDIPGLLPAQRPLSGR